LIYLNKHNFLSEYLNNNNKFNNDKGNINNKNASEVNYNLINNLFNDLVNRDIFIINPIYLKDSIDKNNFERLNKKRTTKSPFDNEINSHNIDINTLNNQEADGRDDNKETNIPKDKDIFITKKKAKEVLKCPHLDKKHYARVSFY